ncbi:hypothetical protein [Serinicoccus marinus]|uniref:hypothetical protein n=1 Tax=Serinicoccus marinus TaxID=247333 RepID=UPI002490BA24|nr:hypothetical protein [Serinicoccus marinus]
MTSQDDRDGQPRAMDEQLRHALGGDPHEAFDHDALVAGVKQRAARIHRRRAATATVAAVVVVPALAASGWVLGNRMLGDGAHVDVSVATQTAEPTPAPGPDDSSATTEVPEEETGSEDSSEQQTEAADTPPWQPTPPPEPVEPDDFAGTPNLVDIPDPRPVDIGLLDRLGAPQSELSSPLLMPLQRFMAAGSGSGGVEPHSGRSWMYFARGNEIDQDSVDIQVTAWDDSSAALAAIRDGGTGLGIVWVDHDNMPSVPEPLPWPGHDDSDHLLVGREETYGGSAPHHMGGALVRQGDYLVGVTVTAAPGDGGMQTLDEAVEAAAEIAQKTADNLAWLDPERANG